MKELSTVLKEIKSLVELEGYRPFPYNDFKLLQRDFKDLFRKYAPNEIITADFNTYQAFIMGLAMRDIVQHLSNPVERFEAKRWLEKSFYEWFPKYRFLEMYDLSSYPVLFSDMHHVDQLRERLLKVICCLESEFSDGVAKFEQLIKNLNDDLSLEKSDSEGNMIKVHFSIKSRAHKSDIELIEKTLNVTLPNSYKRFLNKFNGARIYDYEGLDGFIIAGTEDIIKMNDYAQATFEEDWLEDIIIFAQCLGEGNFLGFKKSQQEEEYPIVDCYFEELPVDWKIIERDFDRFLTTLIEQTGKKYWLYYTD